MKHGPCACAQLQAEAEWVQREIEAARREWALDPTWHPAPHRVDGVWHWDHIGQTCEQYAASS